MTTAIQDPVITVVSLLSAGWNAANTSSVTPKFSTGWYDRQSNVSQVTVTNPEESEIGGPDGYFAMKADGSGPVSRMSGSLDVSCWAHRDMGDVSVNPKQLAFEFTTEVKRIIRANYDAATDLDYVKWDGRFVVVETDEVPAVFRQVCTISYQYQFAD